jgi:hypothetical protein
MNIGEQATTGTLTCQTVNCSGTVKYATLDPPIQNAFLGAEDGQVLIGDTGSDPALGTITPGDGIKVLNGSGSITVSADVLQGSTSGAYAVYWNPTTKKFIHT